MLGILHPLKPLSLRNLHIVIFFAMTNPSPNIMATFIELIPSMLRAIFNFERTYNVRQRAKSRLKKGLVTKSISANS